MLQHMHGYEQQVADQEATSLRPCVSRDLPRGYLVVHSRPRHTKHYFTCLGFSRFVKGAAIDSWLLKLVLHTSSLALRD